MLPVDHHLSHAYTAYCLSPYQEATVLVVDGGGNNNDTETYYRATPAGIERVGGTPPTRPRSGGIGATYEAFTNWLGWHEQEAGKTMALASYGDATHYLTPLFDVVDTQVHGRLTAPTRPASPTSRRAPASTSAHTAAAASTSSASTPPPTSKARPSSVLVSAGWRGAGIVRRGRGGFWW
ncbi:carbamoyltransferase N-terminal domain-containing protein [Streptomyces spinosus]|uniref:carbamoyltransferase N-terminal domain-containing protein n=1 Tax=Streptomyces spinosus TaxID=2872623 RepID=UPI001CED2E3C